MITYSQNLNICLFIKLKMGAAYLVLEHKAKIEQCLWQNDLSLGKEVRNPLTMSYFMLRNGS